MSTFGSYLVDEDTVNGVRSTLRSGCLKGRGGYWVKSSMRRPPGNGLDNRKRREAATAVEYIYVEKEPVSKTFIAVATTNSLLLWLSQCVLGAKDP
jgi:hypothetical protein